MIEGVPGVRRLQSVFERTTRQILILRRATNRATIGNTDGDGVPRNRRLWLMTPAKQVHAVPAGAFYGPSPSECVTYDNGGGADESINFP